MTWFFENCGTFIVLLVLLALVVTIIFKLRKNKKAGKTSCGCSCGDCEMRSQCHGGK